MKNFIRTLIALLLLSPVAVLAAEVNVGANVGINATDAEGNPAHVETSTDEDGTPVFTITTNAHAETDADFEAYVENAKTEDSHVESADVDEDGSVDVAYQHEGKILGVFPVTVTSHTSVSSDANGNVVTHVNLPWWSFLVSGLDDIRANVMAALSANADVKANVNAQTNAAARLSLVKAFVSALSNASANANANAKANASENAAVH
jgi:hypothetical protein